MLNDIKYLIIADYADGVTLYNTAYSEDDANEYLKSYLDSESKLVWVHKMRIYDLHSFDADGKEAEVEVM